MYITLPHIFRGQIFRFNRWLGWLTAQETTGNQALILSIEAAKRLLPVENPFLTKQAYEPETAVIPSKFAKSYARILVFLCRHAYVVAHLFSYLRFGLFPNAVSAADAFRIATKGEKQNLLCLPRSIFIATTSRRFRSCGAMFIGVFLPSHNLHAWVIEDNIVADRHDKYWTLYTPLLMMF